MGFAGIPFPTESTLLLCHFLHFRLIKRILLYFKFFIAETAPGFPFPLYPTTSTSLSCFFRSPLLSTRPSGGGGVLASVEPPHRRRLRLPAAPSSPPAAFPPSPQSTPSLASSPETEAETHFRRRQATSPSFLPILSSCRFLPLIRPLKAPPLPLPSPLIPNPRLKP